MYDLAVAYVTTLTGSPDTIMDWRVINDRNKGEQARNLRGTLQECYNELTQYNQAFWGVFTCINALNGQGHTLNDVNHIRTHVVDLDDIFTSNAAYQRATQSALPPHFAVQSSPDKYHLYWLTESYTGNEFYTLQQRKLNQFYDGDKSIIDATRVMRVPGFYHCKHEPTLVQCWGIHSTARFTNQQIEQSLQHVNLIQYSGTRKPLGTADMSGPSLEWVKFALELRNPNDLSRDEWMVTSAAFKQAAWLHGDERVLLKMWEDWCARYQQNDNAENLKLWNSLKDTEVGWGHFRRVTVIDAYINNTAKNQLPTPPVDEGLPEILDGYNKKIWFKDCYFIERTGEIFSASARFMNSTQFNGKYGGKQFAMSASGSKVVNEAWQAALRATDWTIPKVDHIRFLPDKKPFEIIEDDMARKGLNTYIPIKIKAAQGDLTLWFNHVTKILPNENDRNIFYAYLAHCIKYPGYKIPWAILLQSTPGVGKTVFFEVMQHGLGNMYVYRPKAPELIASGSKFNAWMRSKLAIIVDEIKIDERRELIEILKPMITDAQIEVQAKGVDQEMEDNCANWMFFSNYKDAIPVNQNDRRYCVFFSSLQTKRDLLCAGMDDNYFNALWDWLREKGGLNAITWWLMNYPIEKGSLPVRAPETSSHAEVLRIGRSPIEALLDEKLTAGDYGFKNGYISYPMFIKALENAKLKKPAEYNVKAILESRGYYELGYYNQIISNEDFGRPPLLFGNDPMMNIEFYQIMQNSI